MTTLPQLLYIAQCVDRPGWMKVGKTRQFYKKREAGLNGATSMEVWKITRIFETKNCDKGEKLAHRILQKEGLRLHKKKELFEINEEVANRICEKVAGAMEAPPTKSTFLNKSAQPQRISHPELIWQKILELPVSASQTVGQLLVDAVFSVGASAKRARRLGFECTRFDSESPTIEFLPSSENVVTQWLYVQGKEFEDLNLNPSNTTKFLISPV